MLWTEPGICREMGARRGRLSVPGPQATANSKQEGQPRDSRGFLLGFYDAFKVELIAHILKVRRCCIQVWLSAFSCWNVWSQVRNSPVLSWGVGSSVLHSPRLSLLPPQF